MEIIFKHTYDREKEDIKSAVSIEAWFKRSEFWIMMVAIQDAILESIDKYVEWISSEKEAEMVKRVIIEAMQEKLDF